MGMFLELKKRAENGTRTRDPNLGKVVLYQLSYFRLFPNFHRSVPLNAVAKVLHFFEPTKFFGDFFFKKSTFFFILGGKHAFFGKNRPFSGAIMHLTYKKHHFLIHPVAIVFIAEFAQNF